MLDSLQLLKLAETLVEIAIRDNIKNLNLIFIKDIYILCKDRVGDVLKQLLLN